ncbi:MAG: sulfurtransferase TusA family protein [Actinomycetia bacterium]|nr:sulfurtransferase TusA family protein [Actinomycetes bacterium]
MTTEDTSRVTPTAILDTSGLLCPLPVYKAALALKSMEIGEILELICTDPGALADIPAFTRQRGDRLVGVDDQGSMQVFWIEKGTGK